MDRRLIILLPFLLLFLPAWSQEINLERGLIAYYPFNEDANDYSDYNNHGTLNKMRLEEQARCGSPAYYFDGEESYIDFGNDEVLNQDFRGLTISAWIKPTDLNREDFGMILGKWAFNEERDMFGLFLTIKNTLDFSVADGYDFGYGVYSKSELYSHEWIHVILIWNRSGKIGIFLNGELDTTGKQHGTGINLNSNVSLKMGREVIGQDRPYQGYIDEVRIYGRALSLDEIQALWELENAFCNKLILQGRVLNANTQEPVEADVNIEFSENNQKFAKLHTDSVYSEFEVTLPLDEKFVIYPKARGYLSESVNLSTSGYVNDDVLYKDLYVVPIEVGSSVILNNIFFDTDKAILREESFSELDRLLAIFEEVPTLKVEIAGHTDSDGSDSYNEGLSDRRANAVREYLTSNGIADEQIVAKGYGEVQPIADNDTEEGKQLNRRVEFVILGI